ncbi:MAG: DUF6458 family protein [Actinomycetota bacterium]|nr:DUF6458 family protein [Actinomycetota bacterium]
MYTGTSLFLIALGAILYFAVTATPAGISIQTAGLILMVVGIIGLIVSLFVRSRYADRRREPEVVERERYVR